MDALTSLVKRAPAATARYDWILAITFIAYFVSAFGNGANVTKVYMTFILSFVAITNIIVCLACSLYLTVPFLDD